jgi:hypothetical protein
MECVFSGLVLIGMLVWFIRALSDRKVGRGRHWMPSDAEAFYGRLPDDRGYLDRIITLDMAEHGIFLPEGERVFDESDDYHTYEDYDYEDYDYEDYDDRREDYGSERDDHWGPV